MTDHHGNTRTAPRLLAAIASVCMLTRRHGPAEVHRGGTVQSGKLAFASITVALAGTTLLLATPSVGTAQAPLPECMHCEFSIFGPWPSTMCVFDDWGWNECEQVGRVGDHDCNPSGGGCSSSSASAVADEQAVHLVMRGQALPADGNYFYVVDDGHKAVMRKCDNSVVARVSAQSIAMVARQPSDGRFIRQHRTG